MSRKIILMSALVLGMATLALYAQTDAREQGSAPSTQPTLPELQGEKKTLPSGLSMIEITPGDQGTKQGDVVWIHYTGYFTDGKSFESSYTDGTPIKMVVGAGQVIRGWDEGVEGMTIGQKRRLIIPPALGYGESGRGKIPGNATLIFDIELVGWARDVKREQPE